MCVFLHKNQKKLTLHRFPPTSGRKTLPQTTVSVTGDFIEASEQQLLGEVLRNPKTSERGISEFLLFR